MKDTAAIAALLAIIHTCDPSNGPAASLESVRITRFKEMYLETTLVTDGQPSCAIVPPDDPAYLPLARKVAEAIRQTRGVAPPIRLPGEIVQHMPPRENLIALGVFANNPVVEALYLREFVLCDYNWPGGKQSYVIRTVHNPWLTGKNVVYLGSTSLAGCQAAVDRFIAILSGSRQGSVDPIIEVSRDGRSPEAPSAKEVASLQSRIERAVGQDVVYAAAAQSANSYFTTGRPAWAKVFLQAMRKIDQLHSSQRDMASPSNCQHLFQWFDCIEEGPAFSNEERLELTNLLYRFASRLPEAKTALKPLGQSAGNRIMAPASAALYFSRYYPDLELSKRLLANMQTFYAPDMTAWKPPEDSPHYANLTVVRSLRWALQRPDRRYVDNNRLKRIADYYMLISNNLGQLSGVGDYAGIGRESELVEAYPLAAWLYRDGRYLWWWDHFAKQPTAPGTGFYRHRGQGLMGWVPPEVLPRKRPDDLLGIARAPLDQWIYKRSDVAAFLGRTYEETHRFPIEACYDKVSFRAGFDRDDQYLCLSGFGWGYHSHPDANAIVNYTDRGRTRLYDDGYMVAQPSEHNTVIVLKEGWMGGIPELAQVLAQADFPGVGLFVSRLNDYSGVDWDRAVLWSKSRYFLVIDNLGAKEPGHYTFQCIWRALGKADLHERRWESVNPPGRFYLVACSDARLTQKASAGTSLNAPPFPPDKARRLVQSASVSLRPGESYQLANAFYTTPDTGRTQQVNVYRLNNTSAYLVEDDGQLALAGVNQSDTIPGLCVEAKVFHLLGATLTAAGVKRIRVGVPFLVADVPVNIQLDLRTGEARVEVSATARITFPTAEQAEKTERLEPSIYSLRLRPAPDTALQAVAQEMQSVLARLSTAQPAAGTALAEDSRRMRRLWQYRAAKAKRDSDASSKSPHPNAVRVADVDSDGRDEIFVAGMDNAIHAIGADGRIRWRHPLPDTVNDLNVAGGRANRHQILIGCNNNSVYSLKVDGSLGWSAVPPAKSYARPGYHEGDLAVHQGNPVVVFGSDLYGDGQIKVIVGVHNGFVYAYDHAGKLMWDAISHTPHSMTCGAACDLDGDGRKEIVMGNIYAYAQIFSCDGKLFGRSCGTGHAGAVVVAAADADGNGKREIVVGDKLGKIWLQNEPKQGMWSPQSNTLEYNAGSDITAVAMGDLNGDGKLETAVASKNFLLYAFDAARKPLWHVNLGDACVELDIADVTGDGRPEILCACEDGNVKIVDARGKIIATYQASAAVRSIRACELDGKPEAKEIVASCEDDNIYALQVTR